MWPLCPRSSFLWEAHLSRGGGHCFQMQAHASPRQAPQPEGVTCSGSLHLRRGLLWGTAREPTEHINKARQTDRDREAPQAPGPGASGAAPGQTSGVFAPKEEPPPLQQTEVPAARGLGLAAPAAFSPPRVSPPRPPPWPCVRGLPEESIKGGGETSSSRYGCQTGCLRRGHAAGLDQEKLGGGFPISPFPKHPLVLSGVSPQPQDTKNWPLG